MLPLRMTAAVCDNRAMNTTEYLDRIRDARFTTSPSNLRLKSRNPVERLNNRILMKREDLQPVFSFKLRGAYNKIAA